MEFGDYHPLKPITVSLSGAPYLILSLHKITGLVWGLSHLPAVAGFVYLFLLVFYFRFFLCVMLTSPTHHVHSALPRLREADTARDAFVPDVDLLNLPVWNIKHLSDFP